MKISVLKEKVLQAALIAERVVGKKESLPILSCILFTVAKDITVRSTNLEAGVEVRLVGEVGEEGVVAVPAGILSQTLRSITGEKITLQTEEGNLLVESKGSRTLIKAIPHEEFPPLPIKNSLKGVQIPKKVFVECLQTVSYAASPSMIRPELGSVYVHITEEGITCVATDSFRLAEKVIRSGKGVEEVDILIPLKHTLEILHILERVETEEVMIAADESQLTVSVGDIQYVSRVVDGTFPNYREIIPKKFVTEATVLKSDFSETLKKARVFSGADQYVGLHLYPKKKVFSAVAQSADVGEMSDSIDAAVSGEDIDINFHIGYLADCLPSIASDSISLRFSGAGKPLVMQGVSDPTFTYLVMPLNR
ncbi:DNA polymerase III subunit beta [Candidatus Parcubacteria bacterium]|nr:MAG: DNA polymerase III subunit beta [Candidatus Parcubacteria bacterium]